MGEGRLLTLLHVAPPATIRAAKDWEDAMLDELIRASEGEVERVQRLRGYL